MAALGDDVVTGSVALKREALVHLVHSVHFIRAVTKSTALR
jgi:hypothetical protein